jgi:hypothetical protein
MNLRRKTDQPAIRRLLNVEGPTGVHSWQVITKVFIIANAVVWALLMGWAPNSLAYVVAHSNYAGDIPFYLLCAAIAFLVTELLTPFIPRAKVWCYNVIPFAYMLLGGGYIIFAFMCSFFPNAGIMATNALIQAAMAGWVAYLCRVEHHD